MVTWMKALNKDAVTKWRYEEATHSTLPFPQVTTGRFDDMDRPGQSAPLMDHNDRRSEGRDTEWQKIRGTKGWTTQFLSSNLLEQLLSTAYESALSRFRSITVAASIIFLTSVVFLSKPNHRKLFPTPSIGLVDTAASTTAQCRSILLLAFGKDPTYKATGFLRARE